MCLTCTGRGDECRLDISFEHGLFQFIPGHRNRGEVARLVGVAPINRDLGKTSGKRFIGGGGGKVRRVLYMATVVGLRHNPVIRAYYAHLKSKGKESKVAIVACMRKLLTIMNTMVKTDQVWRDSETASAT